MQAPITSISGIHFPYKKKNMRRIPSFSIDEIRRFWPLIASKVALLDFRTHKQHQKKNPTFSQKYASHCCAHKSNPIAKRERNERKLEIILGWTLSS